MGRNQKTFIAIGVVTLLLLYGVIMLFSSEYDGSVKELAIEKINELGTLANQYYNTPKEDKGGDGSYVGFKIPIGFVNIDSEFIITVQPKGDRLLFYLRSQKSYFKGQPYRFMSHYTPGGLLVLFLYDPADDEWWKIYDRRWIEDD